MKGKQSYRKRKHGEWRKRSDRRNNSRKFPRTEEFEFSGRKDPLSTKDDKMPPVMEKYKKEKEGRKEERG